MINLFNICSYIGRGKSIPLNYKDFNGNIYNIKYSDINDDGSFILNDEIRYNTDCCNLLYANKHDIIFPELFRNNLILKSIQNTEKQITYSGKVIFIRVHPQLYNSLFLCNLLNTPKYKNKLIKEIYKPSKGYEGVFQIRIDNLKKFEIPLITLEEQSQILKKDIQINKKINTLKNDLCSLYNL